VLWWAAVVAVTAGCGGTELDTEPTFHGTWIVERLELADTEIDLGQSRLVVEIDTSSLAVRGQTGCGRLFGSYTLTLVDGTDREGPASFTLPSPAPDDSCPAADRDRHESLVAALETVSQWRREGPLLFLVDVPTTAVELRPAD
jgi:hypothetical protein